MDIKELDAICVELQQLRKDKSELTKSATEKEKLIAEKEKIILEELVKNDIAKFNFSNGLVYTASHINVKKTDKIAFVNYMKEKGIWDGMADVNTQTLKAYIKEEKEKLEADGIYEYEIPGLEITEFQKLNVRES